jgi:ATP-dependent DNA ligase
LRGAYEEQAPVVGCGSKLFAAICASDLEGIVAKWKYGRYHSDGYTTSWFNIKNPRYSQVDGRADLFAARKPGSHSKSARPVLCPELQAVQRVL